MARPHTCISRKVYHQFKYDGIGSNDRAKVPSSDEEEMPLIINTPNASSSSSSGSRTAANPPTQLPNRSHLSATSSAPPLQRNTSLSSILALPPVIWTTPWVAPQVRRYASLFASGSFTEEIYEAATSGSIPEELEVRSVDVVTMAAAFKKMLGDAADNGDFTDVLSPTRSFLM
jgi:hypothetical protein